MLKKKTILQSFVIISIVVFLLYTYISIRTLGFGDMFGTIVPITKLIVCIIAGFTIVISRNRVYTDFSLLWIIWVIWLLIDFYLLGLAGKGISNIIHVIYCPMSFILFYIASLYSDKISHITLVGFVFIYLLSMYLIIENISVVMQVQLGEEMSITNLIYWCLCPLPIILLSKRLWLQYIIIGITFILIIITGKRSATIAIMLIALIYIVNALKSGSLIKNILVIVISLATFTYVVGTYFQNSYAGIMGRLETLSEDQGSGRIPLYMDVFNVMESNTFIDWFFGRGMGSISITQHTNAHNDALQMLFEFGVIGLLVYVIFFIYIVKRMFVLRRIRSPYYIGYMASVIITLVLGMVSNLFVFYSYFAFLCAFWGIVEAKMVQSKSIKTWNIK